ncbi:GNAT family N-acetyltransferase [Saccharothrix sp. Mg75]|uniref:GNAT family N-acetyltransferase n=1 Tax=Saccharothrix sp. Mg75 TaxID=3445357 RepID=UPI003EEF71D7
MDDDLIERFEPANASEADLVDHYQVVVACQEFDRPDEPRLTYENVIGRLSTPFPGLGPAVHWVARDGGGVVGIANAHFPDTENTHLAVAEVQVRPEARRRGIGTALLTAIASLCRDRGRETIEGWQVEAGSPAEPWAIGLGFRPVRSIVIQALELAHADRTPWNAEPAAGYRVERWRGSAPEPLVDSYATARDAIHDAPLEDSEFGNPRWTPAAVRQHEADLRAQGVEHRVVVAVHEKTGEVAGFTEMVVPPHRKNWGYQLDTAVLAAHRGRGLGLAVKAAMAKWVVADHPELERFQTSTGRENTHMIRVNHQLGFATVRTLVAMNRDVTGLLPDDSPTGS